MKSRLNCVSKDGTNDKNTGNRSMNMQAKYFGNKINYFLLISIPFLALILISRVIRCCFYIAANDYLENDYYFLAFQYLQTQINHDFIFALFISFILFVISLPFIKRNLHILPVLWFVYTFEFCVFLFLAFLGGNGSAKAEIFGLPLPSSIWWMVRETVGQWPIKRPNYIPMPVTLSLLVFVLSFIGYYIHRRRRKNVKDSKSLTFHPKLHFKYWIAISIVPVVILVFSNMAFWSAQPRIPNNPFNVIFITMDALRADHLSCYGYPRPTSPHVDMFAQNAVLFENAVSQYNWTQPSYASMLTSQYVGEAPHPEFGLSQFTLAEVLKNHGYRTFGFVQNPYLDASYHFDQGFDHYYAVYRDTTPQKINRVVLDQLDSIARSRKPYFLFVHYLHPHIPYPDNNPFLPIFTSSNKSLMTSEQIRHLLAGHRGKDWNPSDPLNDAKTKSVLAMYDATIRNADEAFGELFQALNKKLSLKDTIIIFNSDHGNEFYERHSFGHGHANLHFEVLSIPLIIRFPEELNLNPARNSSPVMNLDIYPTILDLLNLSSPIGASGRSLLPILKDNAKERLAFSKFLNMMALRDHRHKLIANYGGQSFERFYDLVLDPKEMSPLKEVQENPAYIRLSKAALIHYADFAFKGNMEQAKKGIKVNKALQEKLRTLGYTQ